MNKLHNNKNTSDIKIGFEGDNREIYAHKVILCKDSEIFFKMFFDEKWMEKEEKIMVDFRYDDYFNFVEFIYNPKKYQHKGKVNEYYYKNEYVMDEKERIILNKKIHQLQQIYYLADFYQNSTCTIPICAICRGSLLDNCLLPCSQTKCLFITGICGHDYHSHCISKWFTRRPYCPLCNSSWISINRPIPCISNN